MMTLNSKIWEVECVSKITYFVTDFPLSLFLLFQFRRCSFRFSVFLYVYERESVCLCVCSVCICLGVCERECVGMCVSISVPVCVRECVGMCV